MSQQSQFWERKWKFHSFKERQVHRSHFLSDSLLFRGNSAYAHAHRRHKTDPITDSRPLLQVPFPLTAMESSGGPHTNAVKRPDRVNAGAALRRDHRLGRSTHATVISPQLTGMQGCVTQVCDTLLFGPIADPSPSSASHLSFTNEWVTWSFAFTRTCRSLPTILQQLSLPKSSASSDCLASPHSLTVFYLSGSPMEICVAGDLIPFWSHCNLYSCLDIKGHFCGQ